MMSHTKWDFDSQTMLSISLRLKYINKRDELGLKKNTVQLFLSWIDVQEEYG